MTLRIRFCVISALLALTTACFVEGCKPGTSAHVAADAPNAEWIFIKMTGGGELSWAPGTANGLQFSADGRKTWKMVIPGEVASVGLQSAEFPSFNFSTAAGLVSVKANGQVFTKPAPHLYPIERVEGWKSVEYKGKWYQVVAAKIKGRDAYQYSVRTGDQFLHIGVGSEKEVSLAVADGILTVKGLDRKIDLDRYQAELTRPARAMTEVKDAEGKVISDPRDQLLKSYGNLTQEVASSGKAYPVSDPDTMETLREGLLKPDVGSVVILGDAGTGKTEMVKSFVAAAAAGEFPEFPRTWTVVKVDPSALGAGTKFVGAFESRVELLRQSSKAGDVVYFIDEIHSLSGQGTHTGKSSDFWEMVKTDLTDGMRIIGASTESEWDSSTEGRTALKRRFGVVKKVEASGEVLDAIVKAWAAKGNFVALTQADASIRSYAIELSTKLDAIGGQPSKVLKLLGQLQASKQLAGLPLDSTTRADLEVAATKVYDLPKSFFDPGSRRALMEALPDALDGKIYGQLGVKDSLIDLTYSAYASVQPGGQPVRRVLIGGPKGLGKTEIALAYGEALGVPVARIQMSLYGSNSRFSGPDLMREIGSALINSPFTVIVFDEIEKARPDIQNALLGVLDKGTFNMPPKDGVGGERVLISNAACIFTSNAGQDYVQKVGRDNFVPRDFRAASIKDGLSEYLVDRMAAVEAVFPPTKEEFSAIIGKHMDRILREQEAQKGIERLEVENRADVLQKITDKYWQENGSPREAIGDLNRAVNSELARAVIFGPAKDQLSVSAASPSATPDAPGDAGAPVAACTVVRLKLDRLAGKAR